MPPAIGTGPMAPVLYPVAYTCPRHCIALAPRSGLCPRLSYCLPADERLSKIASLCSLSLYALSPGGETIGCISRLRSLALQPISR